MSGMTRDPLAGTETKLSTADRRLLFACALFGAIALVVGFLLYPRVNPEASIRFEVGRGESRTAAESFLRALDLDSAPYRHAARFTYDDHAKVFLERTLGVEEANRLAAGPVRMWRWGHRWVRPLQKEEMSVEVSVSGTVAGFDHQIPEEAAGASLPADSARGIAERLLRGPLGLDPGGLEFAGATTQDRPARTDHTFTWRRLGPPLGDGELRYEVRIQGDRPGGFREYVHVPEAWTRGYERLRSLNSAAGMAANALALGLLIAVVAVLFRRLRGRDLRWRTALLFGGVGFCLSLLAGLNALPTSFYEYDTTASLGGFVARQMLGALFGGLLIGMFLFLLGLAGESVYRERYPEKLSLGSFFTRRGLRTRRFLLQGAIGLALTALFFCYQEVFYFVALRFGAWAPMEVPYSELLNTAFPWVFILLIGFLPAVSEEFLFRMFPIPFLQKHTRSTALALLLPAFIWGFAHSDYPNQPFFIRGLEVGLAGVAVGAVMLRFGILAPLVWHFTVDALYTATLLFRSGNAYYILSAAVAGGILLFPFIWAAVAYLRTGRFETPDGLRNRDVTQRLAAAGAEEVWGGKEAAPSGAPAAPTAPDAAGAAPAGRLDAVGAGGGATTGGEFGSAAGGGATPGGGFGSAAGGGATPGGGFASAPAAGGTAVAGGWGAAIGRGETPAGLATAGWTPRRRLAAAVVAAAGLACLLLLEPAVRQPVEQVRLDRNEAIAAARPLLAELGEPADSFRTNPTRGEAFSPLEARYLLARGGLAALRERLAAGRPARWEVRFFQPLETREVRVTVSAEDGRVLGFERHVAEKDSLPTLAGAPAESLARAFLARRGVDLSRWELKETSEEPRPRRTDRTFLFEAREGDPRIVAGARPRLRVGVTGDRVSSWEEYLKLPEEWVRARERETLLTALGTILPLLAYGGLLGLLLWRFLRAHREQRVPWRGALLWSIPFGALALAGSLNDWPAVLDRGYTTAVPWEVFLFSAVVAMVLRGPVVALLAALCLGLAAAEWRTAAARLGDGNWVRRRLPDALLAAAAAVLAVAGLRRVEEQALRLWPASAPIELTGLPAGADAVVPWLAAVVAVATLAVLAGGLGAGLLSLAAGARGSARTWGVLALLALAQAVPGTVTAGEFGVRLLLAVVQLAVLIGAARLLLPGNALAWPVAVWALAATSRLAPYFGAGGEGWRAQGAMALLVILLPLGWLALGNRGRASGASATTGSRRGT